MEELVDTVLSLALFAVEGQIFGFNPSVFM